MLVRLPGRCWAGCLAFGSLREIVDVVHVDQLRELDVNDVNEMVHRMVNDGKFELPLGAWFVWDGWVVTFFSGRDVGGNATLG